MLHVAFGIGRGSGTTSKGDLGGTEGGGVRTDGITEGRLSGKGPTWGSTEVPSRDSHSSDGVKSRCRLSLSAPRRDRPPVAAYTAMSACDNDSCAPIFCKHSVYTTSALCT
eukprot:Sspe_Gene.90588::Locus_62109_Transcript_1_1_Confidence_1.000_Length_693::g.90588::m.90588